MALTADTRLGPYQIAALIGAGGMGEVYKARDTKLKRQVAIKVLPASLAADADRLARFQREAEVLASLNHPNIAAIYGLEEGVPSGPAEPGHYVRALVLEFVEGDTIADRIARGPIPVDEALAIAGQIADALEAAHEAGIVHRDLKPANVKITPTGHVKVLDFGLAKLTQDGLPQAGRSGDDTALSTITSPAMMTRMGMILGTAAYMSPEQARGKVVDKRADIWAFGCVLYEMLTGKRAFEGGDVSDTLVAVLTKHVDLTVVPAHTPPSVIELLRRCLERDPMRRLRDIGDSRILLEDSSWLSPVGSSAAEPTPRRHVVQGAVPWVLTGVMTAAVITLLWQLMTRDVAPPPGPTAHFETDLPDLLAIGSDIALSPDGRHIVYLGSRADGRPVLYRRSLRDIVVQELIGTEGAAFPFFSPDGEWVGFHADGELRRVPIAGGRPTVICKSPEAWGASWSTDGYIVFGTPTNGLFRVSAAGGTPNRVTSPTNQGDAHTWPQVLPDNKTVLFSVVPIDGNDARIGVLSLDRPAEWISLIDGFSPRYSPTGHLLFARPGLLMAVPFDIRERRIGGEPTVLVEQLYTGIKGMLGHANYEISTRGHLVFVTAQDQLSASTLVWVDREGKVEPVLEQQEAGYLQPAVSPKGDRLAVS